MPTPTRPPNPTPTRHPNPSPTRHPIPLQPATQSLPTRQSIPLQPATQSLSNPPLNPSPTRHSIRILSRDSHGAGAPEKNLPMPFAARERNTLKAHRTAAQKWAIIAFHFPHLAPPRKDPASTGRCGQASSAPANHTLPKNIPTRKHNAPKHNYPKSRPSQSYPQARETTNHHVRPSTFRTYRSTHSGRRAADRTRIPHARRHQPRQRPALHRTPHSRRQSARVHERRQARTLLRRSAPPR